VRAGERGNVCDVIRPDTGGEHAIEIAMFVFILCVVWCVCAYACLPVRPCMRP